MKHIDPQSKTNQTTLLAAGEDISSHLARDGKTVVLFEMSACPFCRAFQPRFIELVGKRCRDCAVLRVTLDDPRDPLWRKYGIRAVPTVIIFAGGKVQSRVDSVPFMGISRKKWAEFSARS
jgi:thioredoxin-like negative regulator of GroEL